VREGEKAEAWRINAEKQRAQRTTEKDGSGERRETEGELRGNTTVMLA
jgi:hypothetical protein